MPIQEEIQNDINSGNIDAALSLCMQGLRCNIEDFNGWSQLLNIALITGQGRTAYKILSLLETMFPLNNIDSIIQTIYRCDRYADDPRTDSFVDYATARLLTMINGSPTELTAAERNMIMRTRLMDKQHYEAPIDQYINSLLTKEDFPLFNKVEIETVNRCNNSCSFCPVNKASDCRDYHKMSEKLFEKIISELEGLDYDGNICLFSNNEPLLDERIVDFYRTVRKRLPKAFLYIDTNGTLMTQKIFLQLVEVVDQLVIDNYSDNGELTKPAKVVSDLCKKNDSYGGKVIICMRKQNELLYSRGGLSKNRNAVACIKSKCILPYSQLIIRPDGKISLCCNDAYGVMTMGDASKESLLDIWNGEKYWKVRNQLIYGRSRVEMCRKCDNFFIDSEVFKDKKDLHRQ